MQIIINLSGGKPWALVLSWPTVRCFARNVILIEKDGCFSSCNFYMNYNQNYTCKYHGSYSKETCPLLRRWTIKKEITAQQLSFMKGRHKMVLPTQISWRYAREWGPSWELRDSWALPTRQMMRFCREATAGGKAQTRDSPQLVWEAAGVEQSRRESRWELTTCEARGAYKGSAHDETMCCVRESMW